MDKLNVKVLLVDDEDYLRAIYARELKQHVNFVLTAENGEHALEVLSKNNDVDILITDLRMPKMDGLQLIERVSKEYSRILTIIITSNRDFDSMKKALDFGVHDFLDKPIQMDLFAHRVQKVAWQVVRARKRDHILEYLLFSFTNQSMEDFYKMDEVKQSKVLDAVQELICAKISKGRVAYGG